MALADLAFGCTLQCGAAVYPVGQASKSKPGLQLGGKDCHTNGLVARRHLHLFDVCVALHLFRIGKLIQVLCSAVLMHLP